MSLIKTELCKQKKRIFVLCVLFPLFLNGLLFVDLQYRYEGYLLLHQSEYGLSNWQLIFKEQTIFYFSELCHVIAAVIVYEFFAVELKNNGWMMTVSSAYRKYKVILGKFSAAFLAMLLFFAVDYVSLYFIGKAIGVAGGFEAALFAKSFFVQLSAAGMMIAFYMFVAVFWKRITVLIPVSCLVLLLNINLYYKEQVKFQPWFPFTYASHGFRMTGSETALSLAASLVILTVVLFLSKRALQKNYDMK